MTQPQEHHRKEETMKRNVSVAITASLLAALMLPVQLTAQEQPAEHQDKKEPPRYVLVDLGTFGGPNSFVNGPTVPIVSNNGTYAGEAETSIPDPFAPYCQNPDCLVQHAQKLRNGVVTDLGTLPGTNLSSGATWVSANGTIVGASENGLIDPLLGIPEIRAVLWTKDGQIIDLGTLDGGHESFAPAVNDRGQVAGWSLNTIPDPFSMVGLGYQTHGFLWQHGVRQDLGTLGGPDALPEAMNERGQIVGTSYTNSAPNPGTGIPTIDPFLWENGAMVDLGTLGGTVGVANSVNGRGQVVGTSNLVGDQTKHPFLWDRGSLKDLGTFGGSNGEASWISDSGLIVGRADLPGSQSHHAFLWKNGAMTDLGVVDPWLCSTAYSVNSKGQVVGDTGVCGVGGGPSFFSEHGEPIVDVNTLVLPGSDIEVTDAFDINDRGEIAGGGVLPNGDFHAVLLVPASAAEIAAASALTVSRPATAAARQHATTSADSPASSRNRTLNLFRRVRPEQ